MSCNVYQTTYADCRVSFLIKFSAVSCGLIVSLPSIKAFERLEEKPTMASGGAKGKINHENCRSWLASVMPKHSFQDFHKDREKTEEQLFMDLKDGKILCRLLQFLTKEEIIIKTRYLTGI